MMPEAFYLVFTNDQLKRHIWDPLWFPDQISNVFSKLEAAVVNGKKPNYANVIDVLKGEQLKCSATDIMFTNAIMLMEI